MSNSAEKLNDFRRFILRKVAGSEVGKTCSSRAPMYLSAKGRRELNAKIALNGFKQQARIRREKKAFRGWRGILGGRCS
jgi:hypothetical protein